MIIPRPITLAAGLFFQSMLQLTVEEYDTLYDPATDCCVTACPTGSGINILSNPPSCVVCDGDDTLIFNSGTGVCTCQTGHYNILDGNANGGIICFPCLGNLCATCNETTPEQCATCLIGSAFDTNQKCQCSTGYF